jgi:hypothetical protein
MARYKRYEMLAKHLGCTVEEITKDRLSGELMKCLEVANHLEIMLMAQCPSGLDSDRRIRKLMTILKDEIKVKIERTGIRLSENKIIDILSKGIRH